MEFHEKLQQLRKRHELTQEQLAEQLFVSRTAVSKWESGRGYPNLESLKSISKLFCVSIDELLSDDELIELAETENRTNLNRVSGLVFGVLDLISIAFVFMPFFGQRDGAYVYAVPLLEYVGVSGHLKVLYIAALVLISVFGVVEMAVCAGDNERWIGACKIGSVALCALVILFFALSRQPYMTAFLFLLFVVKVVVILKENRMR